MARFYGPVGYICEETKNDITKEVPYERFYKGDLVSNNRRMEQGIGVNDDISVSNQISIVADPYALSHIFAMRYVKWMGSAWKVSNVDVQTPRLILTLGGLYHGETAK